MAPGIGGMAAEDLFAPTWTGRKSQGPGAGGGIATPQEGTGPEKAKEVDKENEVAKEKGEKIEEEKRRRRMEWKKEEEKANRVAEEAEEGGAGEERTESVDITPNQRPGLTMKHPLGSAWTLWFYSNDRSRSWKDNQREVATVTTVEDFWALYHHIEVASAIPNGSDYSLFREGIFPCWDDTRNQKGGRWMVTVDKRQRAKCLDSYWMEILLFLIGEQADGDINQVNGAVVNVRPKGDKLAVWIADSGNQDSVLRVGKLIKGVVGMEFNQMLDYLMHDENKQKLYGKIQV